MTRDSLPPAAGPAIGITSDWQALRDDWRCLDAATDNYFLTWDWLATWWRHHGRSRPLHIITVRDRGRLIGALPLYESVRRPVRLLRLVGAGTSDGLGPLCRPEDRDVVLPAVRATVRDLAWGFLLAEDLTPGWDALLPEGRVLWDKSSPILRFGAGGWEGYLASKSRNFRSQVKRKRQSLERSHDVRITLVEELEKLPTHLDGLFRLHALRWPEGSEFLRAEPFHRAVAAAALARGQLRLWTMTIDGRPAAALYGFRCGVVESFYQSGRDPALEPLSVGFTLLNHVLADAAGAGISEYRFLRGDEAYKSRYATDASMVTTLAQTRAAALTRALPRVVAAGRRARPRVAALREAVLNGRRAPRGSTPAR